MPPIQIGFIDFFFDIVGKAGFFLRIQNGILTDFYAMSFSDEEQLYLLFDEIEKGYSFDITFNLDGTIDVDIPSLEDILA